MDKHASWVAVALLCLGCAAGSEGIGTTRGGSRGTEPTTPMGQAGSPASMTPGGFGNSQNPSAMPTTPAPGATGAECMVGQRCAPTEPDPDNCGSLTLEAEVEVIEHPGNVLLVFDTSSSMLQDWNGRPRWETAGDAIRNALMPLAAKITVGSVFFPRSDPNAPAVCVDPTGIACIFVPWLVLPGGSCGVTPVTSPDQINFRPGAEFLTTFTAGANTAPPYAPVPGGLTPLKEGLQQAQAALASSTLTGITSVVVITDGDPNCEWDANVSMQIVTDWNAMGIRTYVIGLPGTTGEGDAVLTQLATAGGTETYITPDDAATLEQKLSEIVMETVKSGFDSCEITITPPAEVPDKLHLIVTEGGTDQSVPRDLSADASWNVTADGSLVTLQGGLCDAATGGRFERLRFEFGCVEYPPLPPEKVE